MGDAERREAVSQAERGSVWCVCVCVQYRLMAPVQVQRPSPLQSRRAGSQKASEIRVRRGSRPDVDVPGGTKTRYEYPADRSEELQTVGTSMVCT